METVVNNAMKSASINMECARTIHGMRYYAIIIKLGKTPHRSDVSFMWPYEYYLAPYTVPVGGHFKYIQLITLGTMPRSLCAVHCVVCCSTCFFYELLCTRFINAMQ